MNTLIIQDVASGKAYKVETVRTAKEIAGSILETEAEAVGERTYWIEAVLTNDETASDEELVQYFMEEGPMHEEEARAWVAKRSEYVGEI